MASPPRLVLGVVVSGGAFKARAGGALAALTLLVLAIVLPFGAAKARSWVTLWELTSSIVALPALADASEMLKARLPFGSKTDLTCDAPAPPPATGESG